jgi:hypothetical protein
MGQFNDFIHDLDNVEMCCTCGVRPAVCHTRGGWMCLECAEVRAEALHERCMDDCKARWANYQCYLDSVATHE